MKLMNESKNQTGNDLLGFCFESLIFLIFFGILEFCWPLDFFGVFINLNFCQKNKFIFCKKKQKNPKVRGHLHFSKICSTIK